MIGFWDFKLAGAPPLWSGVVRPLEVGVTEPRCEMCGKSAHPTDLGSLLCPGCRARYREFHCRGCGQRVMCLAEVAGDDLDVAAGVCADCHMRARAAALPAADREAIRAAAVRGSLAGLREAQTRLGWSLSEARTLGHVLRNPAEPRAPPDPAT